MVEFKIEKHIAVLHEYSESIKKELCLVSWNNAPAKYDVRIWKDGRPGKGVTFDNDEMKALAAAISEMQL